MAYQTVPITSILSMLSQFFFYQFNSLINFTFSHIVFAPSSIDSYASASFCGLTDLLELVGNSTSSEKPAEWAQIEQHLSVIAFFVKAAGKSLLPVEIF